MNVSMRCGCCEKARQMVVALLGRNGMGKTTLIRSIMGLSPPQVRSGSVRWRGADLAGLLPHAVAARRHGRTPREHDDRILDSCVLDEDEQAGRL